MTPARPWFLALAAILAAGAGLALQAWHVDLLAVCAPSSVAALAVWLNGPAPAWVVRVDAWIANVNPERKP